MPTLITTELAMHPLQSDLAPSPLQWEHSIREMLSHFPDSVTVRRQPAGVLHVIPRFLRLSEAVSVVAELEYGTDGLDHVRLTPVLEYRVAAWRSRREGFASALAARLGLQLDEFREKTWHSDEFVVEFKTEWDDFHFIIRKVR